MFHDVWSGSDTGHSLVMKWHCWHFHYNNFLQRMRNMNKTFSRFIFLLKNVIIFNEKIEFFYIRFFPPISKLCPVMVFHTPYAVFCTRFNEGSNWKREKIVTLPFRFISLLQCGYLVHSGNVSLAHWWELSSLVSK